MRMSIIRHAEPDYENKTITANGHLEAQALAQRFLHERCDRIYSSPVNRAVHTMQYTADLLNLSPAIEPWLAEMNCSTTDGDGRFLAGWNIAGERVRQDDPTVGHEQHLSRAPYDKFISSFDQLRKDSDAFLARHGYVREGGRYRRVEPNHEHILLFCHLGFGLTWLSHLLELPTPLVWSGFYLPPSSVTTIFFEERSEQWAVPRCIGLGDVAHLHMAGLSVSRSGLFATNMDSLL